MMENMGSGSRLVQQMGRLIELVPVFGELIEKNKFGMHTNVYSSQYGYTLRWKFSRFKSLVIHYSHPTNSTEPMIEVLWVEGIFFFFKSRKFVLTESLHAEAYHLMREWIVSMYDYTMRKDSESLDSVGSEALEYMHGRIIETGTH